MRLTARQLEDFDRDGFLILPELFSKDEIAALRAPLPALFAADDPAILEPIELERGPNPSSLFD